MAFNNGEYIRKTFTVFGGVNGVGKSTFRKSSGVSKFIIDPDDLSRDSFGSYKDAIKREHELESIYINNDLSFGRETTLCGKTIFNKLRNIKRYGYRMSLILLDVNDVDICISRIRKRVMLGGHDIPIESVYKRYDSIINNIRNNIDIFDDILFIDNSNSDNRVIGNYSNGEFNFFGISKIDIANKNSVYNRVRRLCNTSKTR